MGYQDPLNSSGERMDAQLRHFMAGDGRLWVIQGLAGIGKTAFMLRQLAGLIEGNAEAMYEIANREEFRGPPDWIPLYLSLRGQSIRNVNDLTDRLMDVVHASRAFWTGRRPNHPEHLLEYPELKWLIYCDGLDEIWNDVGQRNFLGALRHFLDRFPRLKVVLTTRPESVAQDWEQWPGTVLVRMAPMTQEMIRNYVSSQIVDEKAVERVQEIVDSLSASPDLWHLCSFPVCLEAAMKELADVYPQPLEDKTAEAKPVQVEGDVDTGVIETANTSAVEPVLPNMVDVSDLVVTEADPHLVNTTDQPNEEILPPIRPGRVVHGLYVRLWEREINRRAIRRAQTDSWWAGTGKLAIETDGQTPRFLWDDAKRALGSAPAVFWLLNLGIIDRTSQSGTLAYRTEMTKAYFAASYIEQRPNNRQTQRLYRQTTASFRERMHSILEAISTNDLSHLSN